MKKSCLLGIFLFLSIGFTYSQQLISVPDSNFRKVLQVKYPQCFTGTLLDTVKSKQIRGGLDLHNYWTDSFLISNIYEIKYFSSLDSLTLFDLTISGISLPSSISYLKLNNFRYIPKDSSFYPSSLKSLEIYLSNLDTLHPLPNRIKDLSINGINGLIHISSFPKETKRLKITNNDSNIIKIYSLPDSLQTLDMQSNFIDSLPSFPSKLIYLNCQSNLLSNIPKLPAGLSTVNFSYNIIESTPSLTSTSLNFIDFSHNKISVFPKIGPNVTYLYTEDNSFSCVPTIPSHVKEFSTNVSCIPNIPKNTNVYSSTIKDMAPPLCHPLNNSNNCEFSPILEVKIFYDKNYNQIYDAGDSINHYQEIAPNFILANSPEIYNYSYVTSDGNYGYILNPTDTFTIDTILIMAPLDLTTYRLIRSGPNTFTGLSMNSITHYSMAIQKIVYYTDISLVATPLTSCLRPGFPFDLDLKIENKGNTAFEGFPTLDCFLPDSCTPVNLSPYWTPFSSPLTNIMINPVNTGSSETATLNGYLSANTKLGDTLTFDFVINTQDIRETNLTNNRSSFKMIVKGSFDPNDITANPTLLNPQKATSGEDIEYTIRFQNTGTDTAFTVVIKDTLSQMLDASSFNLLANSHPVQVNRSNSNLSFTFNNILLPDSGTNLKGSHGYVKYKVKSTPSLPTNSSITNRAAIYFDFNAPVITNYAISSFPQARITTNLENEQESPIQVYPNPIQHGILKTYKSTIPNAKLYNSSGQLVFNGKIDEDGISLVHLPQGIYLLISETIRQKVILE